jgi:hypothetical protein
MIVGMSGINTNIWNSRKSKEFWKISAATGKKEKPRVKRPGHDFLSLCRLVIKHIFFMTLRKFLGSPPFGKGG